MWEAFLAWLVWLSSDPTAIDREAPRAAAAVAAARASMEPADSTPPAPKPAECVCGGTCVHGRWKPDGKIEQVCPCPGTCACKKSLP